MSAGAFVLALSVTAAANGKTAKTEAAQPVSVETETEHGYPVAGITKEIMEIAKRETKLNARKAAAPAVQDVKTAEVGQKETETEESEDDEEAETTEASAENTTEKGTEAETETETEAETEAEVEELSDLISGLAYICTQEEAMELEKLAIAEDEIDGAEGMAHIIRIVFNRVLDPSFPNTVHGVIFQPGQFSTVGADGRYYSATPTEKSRAAYELVKGGWDNTAGALYFESCKGKSWHESHLTYLYSYGGHRFYK